MQKFQLLHGGDYNPEQWPEEVWQEDMRLFKLAHIDVVTLNVFSWASLQPDENTYDFSKLDKNIHDCIVTIALYPYSFKNLNPLLILRIRQ